MANGQPWQSNGATQVPGPRWPSTRSGRAARSGRPAAARTATGCAASGSSLGGWIPGLQPTGATVRLNPDGTLQVLTGQVDIAGTNIALAQIAATAYGVDIEKVKITTGDTDTAPMTGLSAGSKTIYTVGAAVHAGRAGRAPADAGDRRQGARGGRRRPRDRGRHAWSCAACPTRASRWPRSARRATSTCRRSRRCSAWPTRPSPCRRRRSRPSSRASRSIPTPASSRCTTSSSSRTSARRSTRSASRARCRAARCRASASR